MRQVSFALVVALVTSTAARAQDCDRVCLEGMVNQYLEAMVAHNPFGLPLAEKARFTENEQFLELGDGLWNNVTKIGNYKLYVADTKEDQVGFLGTVEENGVAVGFVLRMKIEKRKIREIETLVIRDAGVGDAIEKMGKPDPLFVQAEPSGARLSRGKLVDAADLYYEAIEQGSVGRAAFDSECNGVINGTQMTRNEALKPANMDWNPFALNCGDLIDTKYFNYIDRVYPRRYPVVDEERQLVFGIHLFQVPGTVLAIESPKGKIPVAPDVQVPFFFDVAEVVKFNGGRIRRIEAQDIRIPYGMNSAWFSDDWRRGPKKIIEAGKK